MSPDQLPPPLIQKDKPLPSFKSATDTSLAQQPPATTSRTGGIFPASFGRQLCYMVAYLLFAGLPIGILAFVTPGAHALTDISIYIFWGGVGIHSAALFIALIASLFQRRWRNAGIYGLCLLVVPLLSCGYCLGAMSLSGI